MHIYSSCRQTQKKQKTKQRSWGLQNLKKNRNKNEKQMKKTETKMKNK